MIRFHWPVFSIAAVGAVLIFTNLGSDYLWEDEGNTAAFAVNVQKFGIPRAWDGVTFIDSDGGAPLNDQLVLISHPMLQYYLAAGSFALFGQHNWAARLPFALAGWLTIIMAYLCAYYLAKNRWAGVCAAIVLTGSVQFLLYCRQCRYYALSMLLSTLLVWIFFNLRSIRSALLFAVIGILLFHSHPYGIVSVCALGLVGFIYPIHPQTRRYLAFAGLIVVIFVLPWIVFVRSGYNANAIPVGSLAQFGPRFIQYAIECASVTPLVEIIVLLLVSWLSSKRTLRHSVPIDRRQSGLLLVTVGTLICYGVAMALTQSSDNIWRVGIRYTTAVMPLVAIAAGVLIIQVSRARTGIWIPLLLLFVFTRLPELTPWVFWSEKGTAFDAKERVRAHLPRQVVDRYLAIGEQIAYVGELSRENPGTLASACRFLGEHANAGDLVLTNYGWESLYFYTRLPQSLRIFSQDPIYQAARRKGLPEYVFKVDGVRWLFWRPPWDNFWGYVGSDITRDLGNGGARMTKVAEFPETIFENRPEIHFHRFPGDKYFFIALDNQVTAQIFRVDWPGVLR